MKILKKEVVYKGSFMNFTIIEYEHKGRVHKRQLVEHPGAVVIIPVMDDGRVIYERQFRFATGGYIVELPAGTLEPDEDPLETAKRELIEETGYEASHWEKLSEFYLAPGYSTEYMHLYMAKNLKFVGRKPVEGEDIEVLYMNDSEIKDALVNGLIRDAKTILGSLMFLYLIRG